MEKKKIGAMYFAAKSGPFGSYDELQPLIKTKIC